MKKKLLAMILAASTCLSSVASPCYADNYTNGTNISIAENFSDAESPLLALQGKVENCIHINSWLKYAAYVPIFLFPFVGRKLGKPLGKYFANKKFAAGMTCSEMLNKAITKFKKSYIKDRSYFDLLRNFLSFVDNSFWLTEPAHKILHELRDILEGKAEALDNLKQSYTAEEITNLFNNELYDIATDPFDKEGYKKVLIVFNKLIFKLMEKAD